MATRNIFPRTMDRLLLPLSSPSHSRVPITFKIACTAYTLQLSVINNYFCVCIPGGAALFGSAGHESYVIIAYYTSIIAGAPQDRSKQ